MRQPGDKAFAWTHGRRRSPEAPVLTMRWSWKYAQGRHGGDTSKRVEPHRGSTSRHGGKKDHVGGAENRTFQAFASKGNAEIDARESVLPERICEM
ncbi:hypothetical protein E2542_SST09441 [Spatholobus suberectus]|nr:hypothetical protein E2542_SST09441 [Spatholobus suberectus]